MPDNRNHINNHLSIEINDSIGSAHNDVFRLINQLKPAMIHHLFRELVDWSTNRGFQA